MGTANYRELADQVPHLVALGFEIALERRLDGDLGGEAFNDLDARGFECRDLLRIIREQANFVHAEVLQDGGRQLEVAAVGLEAELQVGFDRVATLVLQLVRAQLGHEANAAALLLLVEQNARAFFGNARERKVKLVVAIAAQRVEDIAGGALRVNADDRRLRMNVTHDQGDRALNWLAVGLARLREAFETEDAEVSPARGEVGIGDLGYADERHSKIIDSQAPAEDSFCADGKSGGVKALRRVK